MDEHYEDALLGNAKEGAKLLGQYLRGEAQGSERIKHASIAVTQYQRFLATRGVFLSLDFSIARAIASDRQELKELVQRRELPKPD